MATQKEHHYIPQFFFRNFSHDPDKRRINLLLVQDNRVIRDVKISKQAKRHRLYLTNEIDQALSRIEDGISGGLRSVIDNPSEFGSLRLSESVFHAIATAFTLQFARLPSRGRRYHDAIAPLFQELARNDLITNDEVPQELRDKLTSGEVSVDYDFRYDVLHATHSALIAAMIFFDMTVALVANATRIPFLFSDGPAISTNRLLWDSRDLQGITGLGARGLVGVLPICESLALVFFDGGAYECTEDICRPLYLNSEAHVGLINAFQAHSAEDALYFGDGATAEYAERLNKAHRPIAAPKRTVNRIAHSTTGSSELFHYFDRVPELYPSFSFLKVRRVAEDEDLRLPRNELLMTRVEDLQSASMRQDPALTQEVFEFTMRDSFAEFATLRQRA